METKAQEYRKEHDSIGEKMVPKEAYYGVQSLRAAENFSITGVQMPLSRPVMRSLAENSMISLL